jgi:hypothetical protein
VTIEWKIKKPIQILNSFFMFLLTALAVNSAKTILHYLHTLSLILCSKGLNVENKRKKNIFCMNICFRGLPLCSLDIMWLGLPRLSEKLLNAEFVSEDGGEK